MVTTQKISQELEETWNNLYPGYIKGDASNLVLQSLLEDEQMLSVGELIDGHYHIKFDCRSELK